MDHVPSPFSYICCIPLNPLPLVHSLPEEQCQSWSYYCHVSMIHTNKSLELFHASYKQCHCLYIPGMTKFSFLFCNTMTLLTSGQLITAIATCKALSVQLLPPQMSASPLFVQRTIPASKAKTCTIFLEINPFSLVRANKYSEQRADGAGHVTVSKEGQHMVCNTGK